MPVIPEDVQLRFVVKFVEAQRGSSLCARLAAAVGETEAQFGTDENGMLVRRETIKDSFMKVISSRLRQAVLYIASISVCVGHLDSRRMYDTVRRAYYKPHVASDLYRWEGKSVNGQRNRQVFKHQHHLQLLSVSGPF